MRVTLSKWGNSTAVRLPKVVIDTLNLKAGSELQMEFNAQSIEMRPITVFKQVTLTELAAAAHLLGAEKEPSTVNWGNSLGSEIIEDSVN